jgi:hypothetical protein
MMRVEDDLVARAQHRIAAASPLTRLGSAPFTPRRTTRPCCTSMRAWRSGNAGSSMRMIAFHAAPDPGAGGQREASPVILAADAAQQHARIAALATGRGQGLLVRAARPGAPPRAVDVDRIAHAQHRHALHRAPVHVHGARAVGELEPRAAAIHAQLREHAPAFGHERKRAIGRAADTVQPGADAGVGLVRIREAQSQGIHRAGI